MQAEIPPGYVEPGTLPARLAAEPDALRRAARLIACATRPIITSGEGADIQTWMYGAIRIRKRRRFLGQHPTGAKTSGTALAVGAAAAHLELIGEAFGTSSLTVKLPQELEARLDRAIAKAGVTVVNVEIDREAGRKPKTNADVRMIPFSDILA